MPPISAAAIDASDAAMQERCDALLKRVETLVVQLQDQVWRHVLHLEQHKLKLNSRRERAEAMERYGLLHSARAFATAAELRNRLSHEYPTDPVKQARLIDESLKIAPLLLDCVARAEAYLADRGPSP